MYQDFDMFVEFVREWLPTAHADMTHLWEELRAELPMSVIKAAIYSESDFAREQVKAAIAKIGAARMAHAASLQLTAPRVAARIDQCTSRTTRKYH